LDDESFSSASGKRVCDAAANALERIDNPRATAAIKGWRGKH
jgi:hypothetical protein